MDIKAEALNSASLNDAQKLLVQYYEDVTKPTEIAHDNLLEENRHLKSKITRLENRLSKLEESKLREENEELKIKVEIFRNKLLEKNQLIEQLRKTCRRLRGIDE